MKASHHYNLLIVDDEEILREALVFEFERKGFKVFSAENGSKALEIVKTNPIHLIVSDIRMANGDGLFLLDGTRKIFPEIPILIFMTGYVDVSVNECISRGAFRVLAKPFDKGDLDSAVQDALNLVDKKTAS